ncbi:DUF4345 domain-containing protein [Hyphomonas neptunium]|nr:DUF4345 domain-containing protein [Hyphomonas neptunium]
MIEPVKKGKRAMRTTVTLKLILTVAGLVGLGVGIGMVFWPVAFHASAGIVLDGNASLMSEMRASGSAVLGSALVMLSGVFIPRLAFTATLMATVLYISYGIGRLMGMAIDGMPENTIQTIAAAELFIGLVCGAALFRYRSLSK